MRITIETGMELINNGSHVRVYFKCPFCGEQIPCAQENLFDAQRMAFERLMEHLRTKHQFSFLP